MGPTEVQIEQSLRRARSNERSSRNATFVRSGLKLNRGNSVLPRQVHRSNLKQSKLTGLSLSKCVYAIKSHINLVSTTLAGQPFREESQSIGRVLRD